MSLLNAAIHAAIRAYEKSVTTYRGVPSVVYVSNCTFVHEQQTLQPLTAVRGCQCIEHWHTGKTMA